MTKTIYILTACRENRKSRKIFYNIIIANNANYDESQPLALAA